jgi:hypothetical protein
MHDICTYFDKNYIHRGLALYRSLKQTAPGGFRLWTVCLDDVTFETLGKLNLDGLHPVHLKEIEAGDKPLAVAKGNRSLIEYYWTLTPSLPLYIFRNKHDVEKLLYIDADMYFFSSPAIFFEELRDKSILIVPHDYSNEYKSEEHSGKYNVGTLVFRADEKGLLCLNWWRERCLEWCYARHEDGKFGDQGYLNDWPERFEGVVVPQNIGLRPAPWNVGKYILSQESDGLLHVARTPLVCYHFHALRFCTSWLVFIAGCQVEMSREWQSLIYRPYVKELELVDRYLREQGIALPIPQSGFPWRYIGGRILKRQPLRHFLLRTS